MEYLLEQFYTFLPVVVRVGGFFFAVPFLGGRGVPAQVKIGLSFYLALAITPLIPPFGNPTELFPYLMLIAREILVGVTMGFMANLLVTSLQLAGQFMEVPIGFGMVNVFDARLGLSVPLLAQFYYVIAGLMFFTLNAHHHLIAAVVSSYKVVPMGAGSVGSNLAVSILAEFGQMFVSALQLSLPVVGTLFLTDVALGIITRAVPQINVFIVGFPVKIAVGLLVLMFSLPFFEYFIKALFSADRLISLLEKALAGLNG